MKISSKLMLSVASIVLMMPVTGMSANGSDQTEAKIRIESSDSFQRFLEEGRRPGKPLTQLGFQTKISSQCAEDLVLCAVGSTAMVAACVADVWSGGALTPACYAAFTAAGGSCAEAAGACTGGSGTPATVRSSRVGSGILQVSDTSSELKCPAPHRVSGTRMEWHTLGGVTFITKIVLGCTNGNNLSFGYPGSSGNTYACSSGRLTAGLLLRSGVDIYAAGSVCRKVASASSTTYTNGIYGGTGGTRNDRTCAMGKYVVGAKVFMDGSSETARNIIGVEMLCK